jgi:hypothetical protein
VQSLDDSLSDGTTHEFAKNNAEFKRSQPHRARVTDSFEMSCRVPSLLLIISNIVENRDRLSARRRQGRIEFSRKSDHMSLRMVLADL